jgi:hypothetical protein
MKTIFFIIVIGVFSLFFPYEKDEPGSTVNYKATIPPDTGYFNAAVLPVLKKNCSPCHFTGGKMYARMPFDQPATIINHSTGALKRFKVREELAIVKNFIESYK